MDDPSGAPHGTETSLTGLVRATGSAVLNILYPPSCIGCGAVLSQATLPMCHRCLRRLEHPDDARLDAHLQRLAHPDALDAAFALWLFDDDGTVQRLQHLLKYGNRPRYGVALGQLMGKTLPPTLAPDAILPIPLHRARLYERGYNQSLMLAQGVGERIGVPVQSELLIRSRVTRSQTRLSRQARWQNVAGAFTVTNPASVSGKQFLLIDDVLTTGATLAAAAVLLKEAGAASVIAATLALA